MTIEEKIDRIELMKKLDKEQEQIDKLYEEQGLTDEILNKQIEINKTRHENNITDTKHLTYKNYVQ